MFCYVGVFFFCKKNIFFFVVEIVFVGSCDFGVVALTWLFVKGGKFCFVRIRRRIRIGSV